MSATTYPRSYNSGPSSGEAVNRPSLARQDSEQILSYYQSPLADTGRNYAHPPVRDMAPIRVQSLKAKSTGSSSSSDYSSDSRSEQPGEDNGSEPTPAVRRRSRTPSEGGAERRRLAIVQIDTLYEHGSDPKSSPNGGVHSDNLRSRRGIEARLGGLALIASPNAPGTFTYSHAPSTAPVVNDRMKQSTLINNSSHGGSRHGRSASETVGSNKTTRDVGIVGTDYIIELPHEPQSFTDDQTLKSPIFQIPRSPSPGDISDQSDASNEGTSKGQPIITPDNGKANGIHVSPPLNVVGSSSVPHTGISRQAEQVNFSPQVVEPIPSPTFSPTKPSSYLSYQPGVHAIAGPLPPPPRAVFNVSTNSPPPPRPPRLHSPPPSRFRADVGAIKQALQLPTSVSAALAPTQPRTDTSSNSNHSSESIVDPEADSPDSANSLLADTPKHAREGAFPPSRIISSMPAVPPGAKSESQASAPQEPAGPMDDLVADIDSAINDVGTLSASDVPLITVVKPLHRDNLRQGDDNWTRFSPDLMTLDEIRPTSPDLWSRSDSRSRSPPSLNREPTGRTPSPPPKSFRHAVASNLKRLSTLPRTPSPLKSHGQSSSNSLTSRTSSPATLPPVPAPRRKIISQSPSAMFCLDVVAKKTTMERCIGYAQKINELYIYDCGLGNWLMEAQCNVSNASGPTKRDTLVPSLPSTQARTLQPRHSSRTSLTSEVTFPRRPDATTATDLSVGAQRSITPPTAPPPLPYPSLAQPSSRPLSSTAGGTPSPSLRMLSPQSSKASGFFASLGRKASLKKDRPSLNPSSTSVKLRSKSPSPHPNPRSINISNTPSVPGGPRAPPNRSFRSQTIMLSTPFSSNSSLDRKSSLARSPSLLMQSRSPELASDIQTDQEFLRQVDKLAVLLPQADRQVLTGYLRRAGQDILAIGQYLEDEKNGTIRRD